MSSLGEATEIAKVIDAYAMAFKLPNWTSPAQPSPALGSYKLHLPAIAFFRKACRFAKTLGSLILRFA
jgi:hypothetical protein